MRSFFVVLTLAILAGAMTAGCNRHGNAGESCAAAGLEDPNAIGQCAAGTVCAPDRSGQAGNGMSAHWDTATCRTSCSSNTECTTAHETCRPVVGADYLMACQPDAPSATP
jgi:hypothetical protein